MNKQESPYWIEISMESEEMEERVRQAINACSTVHSWTIMALKEQWIESQGLRVKSSEILPKITSYLEKTKMKEAAQRFSFVSTVNQAVSRFYQELLVDGVGYSGAEVSFPNPVPPTAYQAVDVQQRTVWKKYMEDHERISTHYGSVFLEDGWRRALREQSYGLEIQPSLLPYLIYSVTIREKEGWQAHFNLHEPVSRQGKKRMKEVWV